MAFIEARGLAKSFHTAGRTRAVLRGVSLDVELGEFVSIVGAMGSGKSTLLSLLAGLVPPDEGTLAIGGQPVTSVLRDAGFVFQNYSLLPWLTALENVRLAVAATFLAEPRGAQRARAAAALERVGLGDALERRPRQLSGGMRQRVSLARAFAIEPSVLFLDEPFGALDALTRETLQVDLMSLCSAVEKPMTVVMVTNSLDEAVLLSDRIVPVVPGPPASLGPSVHVHLARPRSQALMAHDEHAAAVRADIVTTLTATSRRQRSAGMDASQIAIRESIVTR